MISYHDKTFCRFHITCEDGSTCPRALTDEVQKDADEWWKRIGGQGVVPISQHSQPPECYRPEV